MEIGVLIVDDEEDIRFLIRTIIEAFDQGMCVAGEASSGSEALEMLDDVDPQLVVLDQRMPGLSGVETAEELLQRRPGQPIVFCSAYLDDEVVEKARALGVEIFLTKADTKDIPAVIRAAMGHRDGEER